MTIHVKTETGAYEFTDELDQVRRVGGHELRRDGEWLVLQTKATPTVGLPMMLFMEPLGPGNCTLRRTNVVTEICYGDA